MNVEKAELLESLRTVSSVVLFRGWIRNELRRCLPHSSFLATFGRLYGSGSVPTHRIEVNFPLSIIEDLKSSSGALDDPLLFGWFKTEKLRHVNVGSLTSPHDAQWRTAIEGYGFRSMLIHGVLDHARRRFATFQIANPYAGASVEVARLVNDLVGVMSMVGWSIIDARPVAGGRLVGHPTLGLTPTELHIVELLAQGLSNKEIARRRGVSDSTVKTQVQRTGAKIGATRRAEIVALAMPMLRLLPPQSVIDYDDYI